MFARAVGVAAPSAEVVYLTRVYGARAAAMGSAFLTAGPCERVRWARLSLAVDLSDTVAGLRHLVRRDAPPRAVAVMLALTAIYSAVGAVASPGAVRGESSAQRRSPR